HGRVDADDVGEERGEDGPVVGGEAEVSVVEVGEGRLVADEAAAVDGPSGDEDGGGGAVVGAAAGVLGHPAAELGIGDEHDVVAGGAAGQGGEEAADAGVEVGQYPGVGLLLVGVVVEAVHGDVVQAGGAAGGDEPGRQLQRAGEPTGATGGGRRRARAGGRAEEVGDTVLDGQPVAARPGHEVGELGPFRAGPVEGGERGVEGPGCAGRGGTGGGEAGTGRLLPPQQQRERPADVDGPHRVGAGGVEPAAEDAGRLGRGGGAGLPDVHRAEVAEDRVGVADAADDGEPAGVP